MDVSINAMNRLQALVGAFVQASGVIAREQDLRELGLTSMQMVELMLSIEAEFDVTIPPSKLAPANFRSIESIESLLSDLAN